ncbi:MAG: biopolymer transporter ExbD [Burkholderiaceae bacterium]
MHPTPKRRDNRVVTTKAALNTRHAADHPRRSGQPRRPRPTPAITHTVGLDLPCASAQELPAPATSETITLDAAGQLRRNERPVSREAPAQHLGEAAAQSPQPELRALGARSVAYEAVLQVMAAAQRAGITRGGFVTEPGA